MTTVIHFAGRTAAPTRPILGISQSSSLPPATGVRVALTSLRTSRFVPPEIVSRETLVSVQLTSDAEIGLYGEAHNALNMALIYLRQPVSNVPGATRKAVQALAALNRLQCRG